VQPLILDLQVDNAQAINSINAFFDIYEKGVDGMSKTLSDALGKDVEIGVQLKVEGGKVIAEGVEKINKDVSKVEQAAKLMNGEFGKTPNQLKAQKALLMELQGNTKKYAADGKTVTQEWQRVQQLLQEVVRLMKEMGGADMSSFQDDLVNSQIAADSLMGAFNMLVNGIKSFIATGAEMEVLFLQLKGFTGSTEQAAQAYQRFVEIGQATPFTAKEVASAARTMMGFGIETSTATAQVERLAIVAAATGGELTHMARNMGQIQANQKAYTRDLMQFANQGIPIYSQMADILGVSTQQIREMTEEGQVGFGLVSAALRELTKEGSAYQKIAEDMDKTFSAKFEAMVSAVENFAGSFLAMVSATDEALGGLISGTLQAVIDFLNSMSKSFQDVTANIQQLAPVVASLTVGMGALAAIAIAQNWSTFVETLGQFAKLTRLNVVWQYAWNTAKALGLALAGQWHTVLLAMGVAAGAAALATKAMADAEGEANEATEDGVEVWNDKSAAMDEALWKTEGLSEATQDLVTAMKDEYDQAKENQDIAKTKAEQAMAWMASELEAFKDKNKQERELEKEKFDEFKEQHRQKLDAAMEYHDNIISKEREALDTMRERHSEEMGLLNAKTDTQKKLDALRRKELQDKLATLDIGSKEWLQTKNSLEQMDLAVQREELRKKHKEEAAAQEKKVTDAEADKKDVKRMMEDMYELRERAFKDRIQELEDELSKERRKYDEATAAFRQMEGTKQQMQFETHEKAMAFLNEQILKYQEMGREADAAYRKAQAAIKANKEVDKGNQVNPDSALTNQGAVGGAPFLFTGGPLGAGQTAHVNELGKEAFLSASGRLSMINAPAFGKWRAPESGTVIPAHLTKKLDIPAGGVNLNKAAGGMGVSAAARVASAAAGNVFNQNVTVQAANPVQAANNMMVEMTRMRRRRLG